MLLCAGSAHWDIIARADTCVRLGDDVPGLVERRPGGVAGNIARQLARLGHPVALTACIGEDEDGILLRELLAERGIDISMLHSCAKTDLYIAIEQHDGDLVAAIADTVALTKGAAEVVATVNAFNGPAVVDGNLPPEALVTLTNPNLFLVPASPARAIGIGPLLSQGAAPLVNRAEAAALTGHDADSADLAQRLIARGARLALVTDGARPATLATADEIVTLTPARVRVASVTGAGDATVAGFLHAHLAGASPTDALEAALAAAATHLQGPTT